MEFFCSCDNSYLSGKFAPELNSTWPEDDEVKVIKHAKAHIIKRRKEDDISSKEARELFKSAEDIRPYSEASSCDCQGIYYSIYGDDWWDCLPKMTNPDYEYLDRVLDAAKEGVRHMMEKSKEKNETL
jgi:hypothetical protein